MSNITCAGCGKDSYECGWSEEEPATEDGTYANGKFVCDNCYIKLIPLGLDLGNPEEIQRRIQKVNKGE